MKNSKQGSDKPQQAPARVSTPAAAAPTGSVPLEERNTLREDVLEREQEKFPGIKFGSAFFGWLTATGTAV